MTGHFCARAPHNRIKDKTVGSRNTFSISSAAVSTQDVAFFSSFFSAFICLSAKVVILEKNRLPVVQSHDIVVRG